MPAVKITESSPSAPPFNIAQIEHGLTALFILLWLVSTPILFVLYKSLDPSPDQSIWDYLAWLSAHGFTLYRDSFEVNWPGQIIIHMAAQWLFGAHSTSIRSFDFLLMEATALSAAYMLFEARARVAAGLFVVIYPPIYITSGLWMAGQRDIVAGEIILAACALIANARSGWFRLAIGGALMAFAVLVRPTYLAFLAGVILIQMFMKEGEGYLGRSKKIGATVGGAMLMFTAFVVIGGLHGSLGGWYENSIQYALTCYGAQGPARSMTRVPLELFAKSWHWITLFALCGMAFWGRRRDINRHALLLAIGGVATGALSFVVQHKGFPYHLAGVLPFLVVLLAVLVDSLVMFIAERYRAGLLRKVPVQLTIGALSVILGVIVIGITYKISNSTFSAPHTQIGYTLNDPSLQGKSCEDGVTASVVAGIIKQRTNERDRILLINCGYHAAFLSKRLPASRYATATAFGAEKKACPIGEHLLELYAKEITSTKPKLILVSALEFSPNSQHPLVQSQVTRSGMRASIIAYKYHRVVTVGNLIIFER
jgi:hypothetical protein